MSKDLPTPYQRYYVYSYIDSDGTVVYVGHGCKGRAWHVGYMRGDTKERHEWKDVQLSLGRLPCDWVQVIHRNLTKERATQIEKELIQNLQPELNVLHTTKIGSSRKYSGGWIDRMKDLRTYGLSYESIASYLGASTMAVHRRINSDK